MELKSLFPNPKTPDEFVALLPPALRAFFDREVAAGNTIAETGSGFPAAPVGIWIKMKKGFLTGEEPMPKGVVYHVRPDGTWPAECADERQHFFVLSGPMPKKAKRKPDSDLGPAYVPPTTPGYDWREEAERYEEGRRVGAAIAKHLGLMWDKEMEEAIRAEVGESGLARAKEIDAFAQRAEFWTREHDNMRGYDRMQRELADKFPFLSQSAIVRLATRGAWSWR